MTNSIADLAPADLKIAGPAPRDAPHPIAGLIIRAQEASDWPGIAALTELPKVRWGTLRIPFTSPEHWRKRLENPPEDRTAIVAVLDGFIVGSADVWYGKGRRRHVGGLGMCVHDDFHRRGIGSALMAALIDAADNWLDLKRLELTVYVDNAPAIALYRKFGFEVEGTRRCDAFRDGKYVDSLEMARLLPGWRSATTLRLVKPSPEFLAEYKAALERGWSPDNVRETAAIRDELEAIAVDPAAFVASLDDPDARGGPITLPDGSTVPRLPGFRRWLWDGTFCGSIGFRWQPKTPALPSHVLGHIGYAVVPWKRGRGYAKRALALMLIEARCTGLPFVQVTTDSDNAASQAVIRANGGRLIERFLKPAAYGGTESLRFHIDLKNAEDPTVAKTSQSTADAEIAFRAEGGSYP